MKKKEPEMPHDAKTKNGYNEKNPGQPHGAFPPASAGEPVHKGKIKSTTADKKEKEEDR